MSENKKPIIEVVDRIDEESDTAEEHESKDEESNLTPHTVATIEAIRTTATHGVANVVPVDPETGRYEASEGGMTALEACMANEIVALKYRCAALEEQMLGCLRWMRIQAEREADRMEALVRKLKKGEA